MALNSEFTGKSIEEAVQNACESLKIPKEKLVYEIVSHGASGIFGLVGSKKAKICVKNPEFYESEQPIDYNQTVTEEQIENIPDTQFDLTYENESDFKDSENSNDNFSYSPDNVAKQKILKSGFANNDLEQSKQLGFSFLRRLLDLITDNTEISVKEHYSRILYTIKGGNSAVLIGRRGQTLDAIQYFVEKVINKQSFERIRIQIDVEGYLEKKRINLRYLALHFAEKAKRTGRPWTTDYMNAHDRRIIHLALREDTGVRTKSIGTGFLRKMVIIPQQSRNRY